MQLRWYRLLCFRLKLMIHGADDAILFFVITLKIVRKVTRKAELAYGDDNVHKFLRIARNKNQRYQHKKYDESNVQEHNQVLTLNQE